MRLLVFATAAAAALTSLLAIAVHEDAAAQDMSRRIRAKIDMVMEGPMDQQRLSLTTRDGEKVTLNLAPNVTVTALAATPMDMIKPGSYIGTAALPQPDGSLVALEVHIFMESMRGIAEGHRAWDTGGPTSTMTNATVSQMVASRADARGRMLTLSFPGGEKQVLVPETVPVVAYEPGDRSLIKPGNHVLVTAMKAADGSYRADRITIGRNGLMPPM